MSLALSDVLAALDSLEQQVRDLRARVRQAITASTSGSVSASGSEQANLVTPEWLDSVAAANSLESLAALDWSPLVRSSRLSTVGVGHLSFE